MKLLDFLFENEEQDQDNSSGLRRIKNLALFTKETPIEKVEDALENLANYGQYKSYQQNVDVNVQQEKAKFFGPTGGPNVKVAKAKQDWNSSDEKWRKLKAQDIGSRTNLDITGWENLSFDELPKEARKYNVFYPVSTKDTLDKLIASLSGKAEILTWIEEDGLLVFPRKMNKNVPGDDTLEKVLRTVMDNAGISDYIITKKEETDTEEPSSVKVKEPEKISIPSYNITSTPDGETLTVGDAEDLKDELEAKIPELKPGTSDLKVKVVVSKQNPENAILQIGGFRSNKERSAIQQKVQNITNRLFERKLKRALQVRAGIIK
jgi:hypothetical protein